MRFTHVSALSSLLILAGFCSTLQAAEPAAAAPKILAEWAIGGNDRWDYLTLDPAARRLYIARSTHVSVIDADTGKLVGDIPGTDGVHGVAIAAEQGRGFTSNGKANTVTMFDLKTLKTLDTIKVGQKPDAIVFDDGSGQIFVMNGSSEDATVIDPAAGKVVGTIKLGGGPEFAAGDGKGRLFINIEDKGEVVVVDSKKLTVLARWPLAPANTPTGLSIDREHHRLFVGCRSKHMVILDSDSGKPVATLPIGGGVDATVFDPESSTAYASNGDGTLSVIHEDSPDQFTAAGTVKTVKGSKTMALDPKTHHILIGANRDKAFSVLVIGN